MSEVLRNYQRLLCVLNTQDYGFEGGGERSLCGDIIGVRPLIPGIYGGLGTKQGAVNLILHLEGLDKNEMDQLHLGYDVPFDPENNEDFVSYDKRRYCIPFKRIKKLHPPFNINRAQDPDDVYQPFVTMDPDPFFEFLANPQLFRVEGLVFDKATGRYL